MAVAAIAGSTVAINSTLETTAYAGGTVTADPADATNPRRDLVYYDQTGAVDIATGTATAVTSTTGPALPILTADQIAVAELYVDANAVTIEAGDITDRRQSDSPAPDTDIINYKTSTQAFTTNTTFADVAGADAATFAFAIGANEKWIAKYHIQVDFGGLGGLKLQLTGPSSPTLVSGYAKSTQLVQDGANDANVSMMPTAPFTAFSASVIAQDSTAILGGNTKFYIQEGSSGLIQNWVEVDVLIINGATAGTVTLQAAQNSSDSSTTLGTGCFMEARKIS